MNEIIRRADINSLEIYMSGIGKAALLDRESERELGHKVQDGLAADGELQLQADILDSATREKLEEIAAKGKAAKDEFVHANLRLTVSIARRFKGAVVNCELNDLIQDGNIGLMHAVDKFDPDKGFKFSTYATWWICQHIQRSVASDGIIRLPENEHTKLRHMNTDEREFLADNRRAPSLEELAEITRLPEHEILILKTFSRSLPSLDGPLAEEESSNLHDLVGDTKAVQEFESVERNIDAEKMTEAVLENLNEEQQTIIRLRYLEGLTQAAVAERLGCSVPQLQRLERVAKAKIRNSPSALAAVDAFYTA